MLFPKRTFPAYSFTLPPIASDHFHDFSYAFPPQTLLLSFIDSFHDFLPTSFPAIVEDEAVVDFVVETLAACRGGGGGGSLILLGMESSESEGRYYPRMTARLAR